jgi:glycosyltransferase involved in cell wall biosynthesis
MKVLLIGSYSNDQQHSLHGFSGALLQGLQSRGIEVRLLAPKPAFGKLKVPHTGVRKWLAYIDKLILFPKDLRRASRWADVVHLTDQGLALYTKHLQKVPHVVTCNDMIAIRAALGELPEWSLGRSGRRYQKMILDGLNLAAFVVCISAATRHDVCRISKIPLKKTALIYDSLFYSYSPMPEDRSTTVLNNIGLSQIEPFVLYIGRNVPTKNVFGVLKIYNALRRNDEARMLHLLIVGDALTPEMQQYVTRHNLDSLVHITSGLTNEALCALYSRALAFVFPSFYEGFGLPIIEAQACGCPVFTSDRAPMTEVGGKAAVYVDPADPQRAAQVIVEQLGSTENIVAEGFRNIERFTVDRMIDEYLQIYKQVAE